MKKLIYCALALASGLFAASCQHENLEPVAQENTVTYTVEVPAVVTKAIADGKNVDYLFYEVYVTTSSTAADLSNATLLYKKDDIKMVPSEEATSRANVTLNLVQNQHYKVLFWAQCGTADDGVYDVSDLKAVTYKNASSIESNHENYAAFYEVDVISDSTPRAKKVYLKRPFAQLNIGTKYTIDYANDPYSITMLQSEVTVKQVPTVFNVATSVATGDADFTFKMHDVLGDELEVNGEPYKYVAMNYMFAGENRTAEVTYTVNAEMKNQAGATIENVELNKTIVNVPLKENYRTNIVGNLLTSSTEYEVIVDADWVGEENVQITNITHGLDKNEATGDYLISSANGLAYASQNLFAQEGGSYVLTADIDMTGASSAATKTADALVYNSAKLTHTMTARSFEFDGKGYTIKNLPGMFIAYTGSAKSVVVKNLTLETPNVAFNVEDTPETDGVGAFIGYAGTTTTITLDNCHVKGGKIEGGHWTGGLVGYAAGYSGKDGPVFETLTIKDCSVKNATVTGKGSCGGIIGHATGDAWTLVDMDNIVVTSNSIISTGNSDNKAGSVMGTLGNAGQPTTVNGVTKTGGITIDGYEVSGNTVESNNVDNTKLWGRQGNSNGVLYLNGVKVEDFEPSSSKLANDVTVAGATVNLVPGEYAFPSNVAEGVTITCAPGTVFTGNSKLNINGATVIGATFSNPTGNAVDQTINGTFKDCVFEGANALRYCYAGETVMFENCVFSGSTWAAHFDGGANDILFKNCTFSGFNGFGAELTLVTFDGCTFVGNGKSGYNGANLWGSAKFINTEFVFDGSTANEWIDCIGAEKTYEFTGCTINGGSIFTDHIFSRTTGTKITIDGVKYTYTEGGYLLAGDTAVVTSPDAVEAALDNTAVNTLYLNAGKYTIEVYSNFPKKESLTIIGTEGTQVEFANIQVRMPQCKNFRIENCEILHMATKKWGHLVFGSGDAADGVYTVSNCTFNGVGTQGIYINEEVSGAVYNIQNCTFNGDFGAEGAITIQGNKDVKHIVNVEGCTFNDIPSTRHKICLVPSTAGTYFDFTLNTDQTLSVAIPNNTYNKAPYGNWYGIKHDGGVLDGNNLTVDFEEGPVHDGKRDNYGIMTSGGTIKNLTIKEGCRAVMIMEPTSDVILDNVNIGGDGVLYPINTGEAGAEGVNLVVTNSVLAGWTSYGLIDSASFTNVEFRQGTYYNNIYGRVLKPYVNTTLTNCAFVEHMNLDLSALTDGHKVIMNNCTVNGQDVTAEVFTIPSTDAQYDTELFTVDLPSWASSINDCVVFN